MRKSDPDEMHVQASEEERNFSQAKEVVEILQLQHPLVHDQQDSCALAMEGDKHPLRGGEGEDR